MRNFRQLVEAKLLWVDDLKAAGGKIELDGTILVYHATTKEKAQKIIQEKVMRRPPDTPDTYGVYFVAGTSAKEFAAETYGDGTVIPMKIKASDLHIEDFAEGRWITFYAHTRGGIYRPAWIGKPENI